MSVHGSDQIANPGTFAHNGPGVTIAGSTMHAQTINFAPSSTTIVAPPPLRLFYVPYERDLNSIERQKIFDKVEAQAESAKRVVLSGLGGIGKSYIALEYAYRFRHEFEHHYVLWLSAVSTAKLLEDFDIIARKLNLQSDTWPSFDLVADWLNDEDKAMERKCLMIIDNLDSLSTLDQPLEGKSTTGVETGKARSSTLRKCLLMHLTKTRRLLITTRNGDVADSICDSGNQIHVEGFTLEDSVALFRERFTHNEEAFEDEAVLSDLAKELDCVPLAITQAAAFINKRAMSAAEYLDEIRSDDSNLSQYLSLNMPNPRRFPELSNSVFQTWWLSFKNIMDTHGFAAQILFILAILEGSGVPQHLFERFPTEDKAKFKQNEITISIGILHNYALLKIHKVRDSRRIQVHSLVAASVRAWLMSMERFAEYAEKAARLIASWFPSWDECHHNPREHQELFSMLCPHAAAVLEHHTISESTFPVCSQMLRCLGNYHSYIGRYDLARKYAEDLDKAQLQWADHNDLIRLQSAGMLASVQMHLLNFELAEVLQRQALSEFSQILEPTDREMLRGNWRLAVILKEQGKLEETETFCRKTINAISSVPRSRSLSLGFHSVLAEMYEAQGNIKDAEIEQQKAYDGYLRIFGHNHHLTLLTEGILARLLNKQGRTAKAIELSRNIHSRAVKLDGSAHPTSLLCLWWLAFVLAEGQQYEEAESMYDELITAMEPIWGSDHPEFKQCRLQQAAVQRKTFHLYVKRQDANNQSADAGFLKNELLAGDQSYSTRGRGYEYIGQLLDRTAAMDSERLSGGFAVPPTGRFTIRSAISNAGNFGGVTNWKAL